LILPCADRPFARLRVLALAVAWSGAGCGNASTASDAGAVAGNSLRGSHAFPVNYAVIDTQLAKDQCCFATVLDGGGYASFAIWLSDADLYDDAGGMLAVTPSPSHVIGLQVAGPSYTSAMAPAAGTPPTAITPGVYAIGFEDADDDELCSLPPGGSAVLDRYDFSGDAGMYKQATAVSGTVTLTSLGPGHITGSFDVELASIAYGSAFIDTQHPFPFSGTFDATGM
jgi:hypothetical protein